MCQFRTDLHVFAPVDSHSGEEGTLSVGNCHFPSHHKKSYL